MLRPAVVRADPVGPGGAGTSHVAGDASTITLLTESHPICDILILHRLGGGLLGLDTDQAALSRRVMTGASLAAALARPSSYSCSLAIPHAGALPQGGSAAKVTGGCGVSPLRVRAEAGHGAMAPASLPPTFPAPEAVHASPARPEIDPILQPPSIACAPVDCSGHLALENIRESLIRQEDSIIFTLIERAQYKLNAAAYDPELIAVPGFAGSLGEYIVRETEVLHGKVRRYTVPGEHPFFPEVIPDIILPKLRFPQALHAGGARVSLTPLIWRMYFGDLLPALVSPGDDFNYGSSTTMDVICLQALSKRIHFGAFVAEAKFRESPELYEPLIRAQDRAGLLRLLTFESVEAKVVRRVELKAAAFGQDIDIDVEPQAGAAPKYKIAPQLVARLYGEWIMPLTKEVQVEYLLRRLDPE